VPDADRSDLDLFVIVLQDRSLIVVRMRMVHLAEEEAHQLITFLFLF
jgi:hypothetical protein